MASCTTIVAHPDVLFLTVPPHAEGSRPPQAAVARPRSGQRIEYLDGWRGIAIALVLQAHFFKFDGLNTGRLGVDIFFVLSGFLMSGLLFVKRVPLTTFYKRRISRIFPVFLLFVGVIYGYALATGHPEARNVIYTLTFLRSYLPPEPGIWYTGLPMEHLWSLNIEEHCYILLSLFAAMRYFRGREAAVLIGLGSLSTAIHLLYVKVPEFAPACFEQRTETVASFLLLSAGYHLIRHRVAPWVAPWMPIAAVVLATLGYTKFWPWWLHLIGTPFLLAFAINHLSETWDWVLRALANPLLRLLGIWSYSVYLWQQPFYAYRSVLGPGSELIMLCGALLVGVASFYYFENPMREWINRRWKAGH